MTAENDDRYDVSGLRSKGARNAQRKIAVDGTPEQQRIIRSVISNSFTIKEQKALVSKGDLLFRVTGQPENVAAQYFAKEDGQAYVIEIDPSFVDDGGTYLHEIVHHSRMVDDSRDTLLLRTRSVRNDIYDADEIDRPLEEASTVLETLARESPYRQPAVPSYHDYTAGGDENEAFKQIRADRERVAGSAETGSKGLKGARAKNAVEKNFENSHISELRLDDGGPSAKERLNDISGKIKKN